MTLSDQASLIGHRRKTLKLTDYEYNDLSAVTKGLEWTIITGELAASFFATVAIHEYGHAMTGRVLGIDIEDIQVFPTTLEDGTFIFGYTQYDWGDYKKKSKLEQTEITAGGMIATRTVAEKLDKIMDSTNLHPRVKQAMAALYFMNRFDGPRYILSCAFKSWTNNPISETNDPQRMLNYITGKSADALMPTDQDKIAYAIAVGAVAIDTLLDWKEIETNLRRLFAMETETERENYNFNLSMTPGGVYANFTYEF